MKKQLVKIEWDDVMSNNVRWRTEEEAIQWAKEISNHIIVTGWILQRNPKYIVLASSKDTQEETTYNDLHYIPTGCLIKITKLK